MNLLLRPFAPIVLILLASLMHLLSLSEMHDWGGDFAQYLMQAKSLVEDTTLDFIALNAYTINESSTPPGPVAYPWGFPLLLAPVYAWLGMSLFAFKVVLVIFYVGFLLALYIGLRNRLSTTALLTLIALVGFNPFLLRFNNEILSDIPFLFFSTSALLILNNLSSQSNQSGATYVQGGVRTSIWISVVLGLLIFAAFFLRTNGILLIPTLAIALLSTTISASGSFSWTAASLRSIGANGLKQGQMFFLLLVIIVFTGLYFFSSALLPGGQSSHLAHLDQVSIRQLFNHFFYYLILFAEFFSPNTSRLAGLPIYLLTLPFFYLGLKNHWKENFGFCAYFVLTFMMYVVWPHKQGLRFFLPIVPVYVFFFVLGIEVAQTRFLKINPATLPKLIIAMFVVMSGYTVIQNIMHHEKQHDGPYSTAATEMFTFIRDHADTGDVVVFRKPRVMALMTGLKSVRLTKEHDFERVSGIRYMVFDRMNPAGQLSSDYVKQLFMNKNKSVSLVFENNQFAVYKVIIYE